MNRIVEFLDTFALAAITSTEEMCAPLHLLDSLIDSAIIAWHLLMTMDFMTFPVATGWACQYLSGYRPAATNTTHIYFGGLPQVSTRDTLLTKLLREVLLSWCFNSVTTLPLEFVSLLLP